MSLIHTKLNNMNFKITNVFKKAASLGIIAGMRTFYAPAVVSHVYSRHPSKKIENTPFSFIQNNTTSKALKILAAGEIVGDKMPFAPNRTEAAGLIGRFVSGALCGAIVYKAENKKTIIGAIIGGSAAIAAAFGCMYLRIYIDKHTGLPDAVVGAIEDAAVVEAGIAVSKKM